MSGKFDDHKLDAGLRLAREWATHLSNLHSGTRGAGRGSIYALYARLKVGGRWLAVAKRYSPATNEPEVCFGEGSTLLLALKELNGGIAAQRWRVDRPYGEQR